MRKLPPGAPPAPVLTDAAGRLVATAQGGPDWGGVFYLQYADGEPGPWFGFSGPAWEPVHDFGVVPGLSGFWVRVLEGGNGADYVGNSLPSNAFLYVLP